jgi:hypothetical protein
MLRSVSSHSGTLGVTQERRKPGSNTARIFGLDPRGGPNDPLYWAKEHRKQGNPLPALWIDYGAQDKNEKEMLLPSSLLRLPLGCSHCPPSRHLHSPD